MCLVGQLVLRCIVFDGVCVAARGALITAGHSKWFLGVSALFCFLACTVVFGLMEVLVPPAPRTLAHPLACMVVFGLFGYPQFLCLFVSLVDQMLEAENMYSLSHTHVVVDLSSKELKILIFSLSLIL